MLDNTLIENALKLTGGTYWCYEHMGDDEGHTEFSIEKFCYYLLSPEFVEKYHKEIKHSITWILERMGPAIYEYQSGNEKPLIELLSKIK